MDAKLSLFQGKEIRKVFHNEEWWFVVEDVVDVLTKGGKQKMNCSNAEGIFRIIQSIPLLGLKNACMESPFVTN